MRGVSIGERYWGILWETINHESLFSSVRMDRCQRETEDVTSIYCPAAFLAANSATSCPALSILSPLLSFWMFLRNKQTEQNGPRQRFWETDFFPSFLGGCAHQADTWHSIFLCAHINDSVAYWNYRVGSSGKIAEEFWDSGQMLDAQYKLKYLRQEDLCSRCWTDLFFSKFNCHILEFLVFYCSNFE